MSEQLFRQEKIEHQADDPELEKVKTAVREYLESRDKTLDPTISFLRQNPQETTEFCLQVFETYREGDTTGIIELARLIENLIEKVPETGGDISKSG